MTFQLKLADTYFLNSVLNSQREKNDSVFIFCINYHSKRRGGCLLECLLDEETKGFFREDSSLSLIRVRLFLQAKSTLTI